MEEDVRDACGLMKQEPALDANRTGGTAASDSRLNDSGRGELHET